MLNNLVNMHIDGVCFVHFVLKEIFLYDINVFLRFLLIESTESIPHTCSSGAIN